MEQEQEQEFTPQDLSRLRGLIRDIADLADQDLANSGSPASMFGPWRLMMRQILEAAAAYEKAHPESVDTAARDEVREFLDSGLLDPDGVATVPDPVNLLAWLQARPVEELKQVMTEPAEDQVRALIRQTEIERLNTLADALDTAYKAGAGAPPSHGSRFARR